MLSPWDLPEPYAPRRRRPWRVVTAFALLVAAIAAATLVPIPGFFVYLPGPVRDTHELTVVSEAAVYTSDGELLLTTVSVDTEVTFVELLAASVDRNKDVVPAEQVTGGLSLEETRRLQSQQMEESKRAAREVALRRLGLVVGAGALVEETVPGSPADASLLPGDVLIAIDGVEISSACQVRSEIVRRDPGQTVDLTVRRAGGIIELSVTTVASPQDPSMAFLGVGTSDAEPERGVDVRFRTREIGGPSAGLMFSLALYDRLTPGDLTGGRTIAGTGEIACDGTVGPIGGIEEKIAAAVSAGASYFLAPESNAQAARGAAPGQIEVVAIATFADAVAFLEDLSRHP